MFTQELNRYERRTYSPPALFNHNNNDDQWRPLPGMNKLEYANFLKTIPFKKGDIVVHDDANPNLPYNNYQLFVVHEIIEVHHQVNDWGTKRTGPRCVWMSAPIRGNSIAMKQPWLSTTLYKPVPYENLPDDWKAYVDARTESVQQTDSIEEA